MDTKPPGYADRLKRESVMAEPLRIMSLHALEYCERLFYLEEVEELRVADASVYAGRRLHVEIEKKEDKRDRKGSVLAQPDVKRRKKKLPATKNEKPAWETQGVQVTQTNADEAAQAGSLRYNERDEATRTDTADRDSSPTVREGSEVTQQTVGSNDNDEGEPLRLNLESGKWGLTGKVDFLRRRDGRLIPYEHKRGRSARSADNKPEAWASDRLQVIAYAALIAEHNGQELTEGRIRYHADNVMVRVPIDDAALNDLKEAIRRARVLQGSIERPPVLRMSVCV